MLQIIGLLGCLYLFVKGLEIRVMAELSPGRTRSWNAIAGSALAILGSCFFAVWLIVAPINFQSLDEESVSGTSSSVGAASEIDEEKHQEFLDCMQNARSQQETLRC